MAQSPRSDVSGGKALITGLEETPDLSSLRIYIDPAIGRIRAGSWHEAYGTGDRDHETRTFVSQNIPHKQVPSLGYALDVRVV